MKKYASIFNRVIAALTFSLIGTQVAFAAPPVRVELMSSPIPLEMSVAWGKATVNLTNGRGTVRVWDLPENSATGTPSGATLRDSSTVPPTPMKAVIYRAWLMRVDVVDGDYFLTDGIDLGTMKLGKNETGMLNFNTKTDLRGHGFNIIAVTAEEDSASYSWAPGVMIQAFTVAGSSNGMIVLWGEIEPLP